MFEGGGLYLVPDYAPFLSLISPLIPQNNHSPRADIDIPLNLAEVARVQPLLTDVSVECRFLTVVQTAGRFYLQALQNFEYRPDIAYLHLITAGEVLSNYYDYDKSDLLDDDAKDLLAKIEASGSDGPALASRVRGKLLQIKRRFVRTIDQLTNDHFFAPAELASVLPKLRKADFARRIGAAYDLRSQHVHTGIPFGKWVNTTLAEREVAEIQVGFPVLGNKDFEKVLWKAPTYYGLERVIRYCLLTFIHRHGIAIDSRLGDRGPNPALNRTYDEASRTG